MFNAWIVSAALAFSSSPPAKPDSVWVGRPDGALSCEPKSGEAIESGAGELRKAKIQVLDSRKGTDGKMHIQVCGAPKGSLNSYLIPRKELPLALSLGFQEIPLSSK